MHKSGGGVDKHSKHIVKILRTYYVHSPSEKPRILADFCGIMLGSLQCANFFMKRKFNSWLLSMRGKILVRLEVGKPRLTWSWNASTAKMSKRSSLRSMTGAFFTIFLRAQADLKWDVWTTSSGIAAKTCGESPNMLERITNPQRIRNPQ